MLIVIKFVHKAILSIFSCKSLKKLSFTTSPSYAHHHQICASLHFVICISLSNLSMICIHVSTCIIKEDTFPSFFNKRVCELTEKDNFQSWKQRVLLAVRGLNLKEYLFRTLYIPHMIDDGEGTKVLNPEYSKLSQQDSSLASWLLAIISTPISKGLVGCMTVASIWSKLPQHFSSSSTTRIMNLYD